MLAVGALLILVVVVVLLVRGRRRPAGERAVESKDTPWESLDRGEDPTEPA